MLYIEEMMKNTVYWKLPINWILQNFIRERKLPCFFAEEAEAEKYVKPLCFVGFSIEKTRHFL